MIENLKRPLLTSAIAIALAALLSPICCSAARKKDYFEILVVDDSTGRGVPLVELTQDQRPTLVSTEKAASLGQCGY